MQDFEAEGRYHQYTRQGRAAATRHAILLGNVAWHAEHARTHPESPSDTARMRAMLDEIDTLERQVEACLKQANAAADLAGLAGLTRMALFLPERKKD